MSLQAASRPPAIALTGRRAGDLRPRSADRSRRRHHDRASEFVGLRGVARRRRPRVAAPCGGNRAPAVAVERRHRRHHERAATGCSGSPPTSPEAPEVICSAIANSSSPTEDRALEPPRARGSLAVGCSSTGPGSLTPARPVPACPRQKIAPAGSGRPPPAAAGRSNGSYDAAPASARSWRPKRAVDPKIAPRGRPTACRHRALLPTRPRHRGVHRSTPSRRAGRHVSSASPPNQVV